MKNSNVILVLLGVVAVFVLGVILLNLRAVLLPFFVALLLSFIFQPVVLYLKSKKIPTAVSLIAVLFSLALVLFLVGLLVYSSARSFNNAWDAQYKNRIESIIADSDGTIKELGESLGVDMAQIEASDIFQASTVTSMVSTGVGSLFSSVGNIFLVILFMLFILAGSGDLGEKIKHAYPDEVADRLGGVTKNISKQVRQYLAAKTLVSAITGFLIFLVLWILGVDFPVFWGFLAFLLNFIPNIGSLVAVIFPFLVSLLQFDTLTIPILALIFMQVVQTVMGNVVDPKLMAFSLNLSPLLVLVSLIFWGWLWGIVGMILAVPLTATIKIIFENIEPLRPVAVLMGGPITPKEKKAAPVKAAA